MNATKKALAQMMQAPVSKCPFFMAQGMPCSKKAMMDPAVLGNLAQLCPHLASLQQGNEGPKMVVTGVKPKAAAATVPGATVARSADTRQAAAAAAAAAAGAAATPPKQLQAAAQQAGSAVNTAMHAGEKPRVARCPLMHLRLAGSAAAPATMPATSRQNPAVLRTGFLAENDDPNSAFVVRRKDPFPLQSDAATSSHPGDYEAARAERKAGTPAAAAAAATAGEASLLGRMADPVVIAASEPKQIRNMWSNRSPPSGT